MGIAQLNGGLACVGLPTGNIAVWWVEKDGSIKGTDWGWRTSGGIIINVAPEGSAQVTKPVSTVASGKGRTVESPKPSSTLTALNSGKRTHIWWITPKGAVQGRGYEDKMLQETYVVAQANSAALGTRIAAVSRTAGVLNLFFISPLGELKHFFWPGPKQPAWTEDKEFTTRVSKILNQDVELEKLPLAIARVDSDIKAVSMNQDRVDVFWVHPNNALCQVSIYQDKHREFIELLGPGSVMAGSPLGVLSHRPNSIMLAYRSSKNLTKVIEFGS
jgi:hypothetical protein